MRPGAIHESSFAIAMTTLPVHIDQAKKISHDAVILAAGPARTSGVTWTVAPMAEWRSALDELGIPVPADRVKGPDDLELLAARYPLGALVVATVEVNPEIQPEKNPDTKEPHQ